MANEKFTPETILQIVEMLTGKVEPLGDASRDPDRLYNLKTLCAVTESLVGTIHDIASEHEHNSLGSVQPIQRQAAKFLKENRIPIAFYEEDAIEDLGTFMENNYEQFPNDAAEEIFNFLKSKGYIIV